jgi:hypothetical protein
MNRHADPDDDRVQIVMSGKYLAYRTYDAWRRKRVAILSARFISSRFGFRPQHRKSAMHAVTADFRTLPKKQARIAALSKRDCSFFQRMIQRA